MSRATAVLSVMTAIALAVACGPSIRRTYQSDNAFARCFDMDYNPGRQADEKRECWSMWLGEYVYNQPDDKLTYAELRIEELDKGISVPGPPGPEGAFHERPVPPEPDAGAVEAEPVEQERVETEPTVATASPGDAGAAELPARDCEAMCKKSFVPCSKACGDAAGEGCAAACETGYKSCMRDCFAD